MKTIQSTQLPHHHNGFVTTCWLWTGNAKVHALTVIEPTENRVLRKHEARSINTLIKTKIGS